MATAQQISSVKNIQAAIKTDTALLKLNPDNSALKARIAANSKVLQNIAATTKTSVGGVAVSTPVMTVDPTTHPTIISHPSPTFTDPIGSANAAQQAANIAADQAVIASGINPITGNPIGGTNATPIPGRLPFLVATPAQIITANNMGPTPPPGLISTLGVVPKLVFPGSNILMNQPSLIEGPPAGSNITPISSPGMAYPGDYGTALQAIVPATLGGTSPLNTVPGLFAVPTSAGGSLVLSQTQPSAQSIPVKAQGTVNAVLNGIPVALPSTSNAVIPITPASGANTPIGPNAGTAPFLFNFSFPTPLTAPAQVAPASAPAGTSPDALTAFLNGLFAGGGYHPSDATPAPAPAQGTSLADAILLSSFLKPNIDTTGVAGAGASVFGAPAQDTTPASGSKWDTQTILLYAGLAIGAIALLAQISGKR